MKVLVIGGGGREHAVCLKLSQSPLVDELLCAPGNGGIAQIARCFPDVKATDLEGVKQLCRSEKVDFVVVTPDDPLALGMVDMLNAENIPAFGPVQAAARMESSKIFAKELMRKYNIPTARYAAFDDVDSALEYVRANPAPIVIKADGLALGKGVIIAQTTEEAEAAVRSMMVDGMFNQSGKRVVIEEFMRGPECTVLCFCDGKTIVPMPASQDHKRALDGDKGLNTGGMGAIAPLPLYNSELAERVRAEILQPTLDALRAEGIDYRGVLYVGLMITESGPRVVEYNSRFGDPETQVVLPMLDGDLFEIMRATTDGTLADVDFSFRDGAVCCVVAASAGYPEHYEKGFPITLPADHDNIYIAGSRLEERDGRLVQLTNGGRVLGVTETAPTLQEAVDKAYDKLRSVHFENMYYRKDIGAKALAAAK